MPRSLLTLFFSMSEALVDDDDDLHLVAEGPEHLHLAVGLEAGQDPGRVIVVEELAAEFQIELAAEGVDPLADVLGLEPHVLVVVKTDPLHVPYLPKYTAHYIQVRQFFQELVFSLWKVYTILLPEGDGGPSKRRSDHAVF